MTPYVQRVLQRYRRLPHTLGHVRPSDRQLAAQLERRGLPLHLVEAALCLAALRRILRPPSATPLPPIRSLHYIRPILDELLEDPPSPGYLRYLEHCMHRYAPNPR